MRDLYPYGLIRADYSDIPVHCHRSDHELIREIHKARQRALDKHGVNSCEKHDPHDFGWWLAVLMEEVGEAAQTLTYDHDPGQLRSELIDVAAVVTAWIDGLDYEERRSGR